MIAKGMSRLNYERFGKPKEGTSNARYAGYMIYEGVVVQRKEK